MIVPVPSQGDPEFTLLNFVSETVNFSFFSSTSSSMIGTVIVFDVSPLRVFVLRGPGKKSAC